MLVKTYGYDFFQITDEGFESRILLTGTPDQVAKVNITAQRILCIMNWFNFGSFGVFMVLNLKGKVKLNFRF